VLVLAVKVLVEVLRAPHCWQKPGGRKSANRGRESVIKGRESALRGLTDNKCVVDFEGVSVVPVR
jgi:hypothetical protein